MRILFTGITSFIGNNLAYRLLDEGHEVFALVRPKSEKIKTLKKHENLYLITRDMKEVSLMNEKVLPRFDVCVHLAWDGTKKEDRMNEDIQKENEKNTLDLIKKCKDFGVKRFLFAGSQAEYGQTLEKHTKDLCKEDFIEEPISMYGKAKLEVLKKASSLCASFNMEYLHLRIFSVYGALDHENSLISYLIRKLKNKDKIKLSPCIQLWNYIYIEDIVRIFMDFIKLEELDKKLEDYGYVKDYKKNLVNIASEDTRVLKDFVYDIIKFYEEKELEFSEYEDVKEGIPYLNPSIDKLKFLIDFKQKYSFVEGIREIKGLIN